MPDDLRPVLRALLPPGGGVGQADTGALHTLWPGEGVPGATPARLREFAAGRAAFRAALADAGRPPCALPMAPDRSPVWPAGLALSITHDAGLALAAVLPGDSFLGIDLQTEGDLPPDLQEIVLLPPERAGPLPPMLVFAAKEAAYKALFPTLRRVIGFDAIEMHGTPEALTARLRDPPMEIAGRAARAGRRWLVAFVRR